MIWRMYCIFLFLGGFMFKKIIGVLLSSLLLTSSLVVFGMENSTNAFSIDNTGLPSQTILSETSDELVIYYKNIDLNKFNNELEKAGWVDEPQNLEESFGISDISYLKSYLTSPLSLYATSTKSYSGKTSVSGVLVSSQITVTLHANMEITSHRIGNNLYDVFVRVINTSASLASSGYTFANSFNVGSTLKSNNTELILSAFIQLQYQQSYAVSGSLSFCWGSIGGSTGSTYYYRGPVNEKSISIKLPSYWILQ